LNAASTRPQCTLKQKRYKVVPTNVSAADVVFSDPLHAIGNQGTNEVYFARLDQVEPAATRTVYGKLDQGALKQPMLAPKPVHLGKADTVALQQRLIEDYNRGKRPGMVGLKGANPGYHPTLAEHHQNKEAIFGERLLSCKPHRHPPAHMRKAAPSHLRAPSHLSRRSADRKRAHGREAGGDYRG
jgi:hypothetical protein